MSKQNKNNLPLIVILLDGWGIAPLNKGNAPALAKTPYLDKLTSKYSYTELSASGKHVGLPNNEVGNSEAGHMNIGSGRIVKQDAVIINEAIKNGTFFKNTAFKQTIKHVIKNNSSLHLMGLLAEKESPHSNTKHLYSLLEIAREAKVKRIYIHLFTDGRDSPQFAGLKSAQEVQAKLRFNEKIVTIMGRFYAMDRKKKWSRTELAYDAIVLGKGENALTTINAITESYNKRESDEFIKPYIIGDKEETKESRIKDNDGIIFFNLRSDRARQLTKAFVQKDFHKKNKNSFKPKKILKNIKFTALTDFGPDLNDILTAYPSIDITGTLPEALKGITQIYMAESEKFAHVTYFFNGGYDNKLNNEDYYVLESPNVESYDKTPVMRAGDLTKKILENLSTKKYDFTFVNFAAPDMVGHTGNITAAIECCEKIDNYVHQITNAYLEKNGTIIITADHGNLDEMIDLKTNEVMTKHSANKVPFILINKKLGKTKLKTNMVLGDISPTILKLIERDKPKEMTGKSIL